jgi:Fe-S oxidoreductase
MNMKWIATFIGTLIYFYGFGQKLVVSDEIPLVGIEPSAILTFRDEYIRLAEDKAGAEELAKHVFTIEEFFKNEIEKGAIHSDQFSDEGKEIKIHGHCHQKSLS